MSPRCDQFTMHECDCPSPTACAVQPKTVAPLIRPERQDIKTAIAFGILVAGLVFGGAHVLNHYERQVEIAERV